MSSGKKIVFFGNERLATGVTTTAPTLQALISAGYQVAAVVANYEKASSRSSRQLEIQEVAKKYKIPVLLPNKPTDIADDLTSIGAEVGVLVAYGKIVTESIINIFPKGIINIHPSLLPLHRGPTPIESAILDGADKTGVSIMSLVREMDAGPVYAQSELPLEGAETKQHLADALLEIGKSMIIELLPEILDGRIVAMPQDHTRATYDNLITKDQGLINWDKPAEILSREVRAFADWPKSRATIANKDVVITQAYAVPSIAANSKPGDITIIKEAGLISVATTDGSLWIEKLKPAGKKEMTAKEFITGYRL